MAENMPLYLWVRRKMPHETKTNFQYQANVLLRKISKILFNISGELAPTHSPNMGCGCPVIDHKSHDAPSLFNPLSRVKEE